MRSNIKAWMERARLGKAKALKYLTKQKRKLSDSWPYFLAIWFDWIATAIEEVARVSRRLRRWQVVVAILLLLAFVMWVYRTEIWAYLSPAGLDIESHFKNPNDIAHLRNLGLILLGVIGLPLAIWRSTVAQQQIYVVQKGQYADRFAKAAAMLADDSLPVREAGIFALRELAIADPKGHYFQVQDLLCSFMRDAGRQAEEQEKENTQSPLTLVPNHKPEADDPAQCPSDVIAALRAFSDLRTPKNKRREEDRRWQPDLRKVRLTKFPGHSEYIDLSNANLQMARLQRAMLNRADLRDARLVMAKLQGAWLQGAQLQRASLEGAQFQDADLEMASLEGAWLQGTSLQGARLQWARLQAARLEGADLKGVSLEEADLKVADLQWADLYEAKLPIPIWPKDKWPEGLVPSEVKVKKDIFGETVEYFTFIRADEEDKT